MRRSGQQKQRSRQQVRSADGKCLPCPTAIVGPGIAATAVSTLVAVAFCKAMDRK